MSKVTEFPVAYVLRHNVREMYVPHTNFSSGIADYIAKDKTAYYAVYYTDDILLAKMWTTHKKIKRFLTKEAAKFFDVISSDHTVVPATDLFK
jgi:hypothetical protein